MTTMNATVWGVTAETVYLSPAPVYHAAPLRTCTAVQALGGTVVVMDRFETLPFEYHNASEKTSGAQHPAHPTWTTTGDVGYLDEDGYLFLTDRDSFKIISGGVNISPQEIENALVEHPKVLDACVIGLPDNEMAEIVTAVIDPGTEVDGDDALATELLDYLRERIAKYKLPRRIEFTHDLPRTPTGKLAKRTLKERFANTSVR